MQACVLTLAVWLYSRLGKLSEVCRRDFAHVIALVMLCPVPLSRPHSVPAHLTPPPHFLQRPTTSHLHFLAQWLARFLTHFLTSPLTDALMFSHLRLYPVLLYLLVSVQQNIRNYSTPARAGRRTSKSQSRQAHQAGILLAQKN